VSDDGGLPAGWGLSLDPATRRTDEGHVLVGGSPLRVLRLSPSGADWLDRTLDGEPVSPRPAHRALARRLTDAGLAIPHPDGRHAPRPEDLAVVIPVLDDADGLRRTLASLGPAGEIGEVVVVDDGSADPAALRHAAGPATTILRNDTPQGPGDARQRGWQATDKRFVAFVDAEVEPEPGCIEALLAYFADPSVGAVAPRIVARPGSAPSSLERFESVRSPLDLGPTAAPVRPASRVPYVPTALLLVRRAALTSVGGFEAGLRVGEDVDLVWRIHRAGWRVRYDPGIRASHPTRPDLRSWLRQRRTYGRSAAALARRHGDAMAPLKISGWSANAWAAALLGRPGLGAGIGAGTTLALTPKLRGLDHPLHEAMHIAGKGNLWAGHYVADALRRPWWPLSLGLGVVCRRARPALAAAAVLPALLEWRERRPRLDPARYAALRLAEDLAYGTGVWLGSVSERTSGALRPSFTGALRLPDLRPRPTTTAGPDASPADLPTTAIPEQLPPAREDSPCGRGSGRPGAPRRHRH
jgi:mycofactocin glycosyltransferase